MQKNRNENAKGITGTEYETGDKIMDKLQAPKKFII